ncbi:oxidoreductase, partial [Pseudoalteromonas ruthenica]
TDTKANDGLSRIRNVVVYRDFIFARLSETGVAFEDYFGESLSTIDNMVDRSPEGKLAVEAAPIRYMHTCNWK